MPARKILIDLRSPESLRETIKKIRKTKSRVNDIDSVLDDIESIIKSEYILPLMRKLRQYPPHRRYPEDYPIKEWASEKQRRYVMGILLKGKPYKRTGRFKRGWQYKIRRDKNKISIEVSNKWDKSQYVVGKLGMGYSSSSIKRYMKPMQKMHLYTGWFPAYLPVRSYITKAKRRAKIELQKWIQNAL